MKFSATLTLILGATLAVASTSAFAKDVVVFSAGAVKAALSVLAPVWETRSGDRLMITYAAAGDLRKKLAAGERADLLILPLENFAAVEQQGLTDAASRRDLGSVGIGIAVKAGAALPDISSEESLKRALLATKSITYMDPNRGTSGKHFDEVVLTKLAIRDAVRAKAVLGEGGTIADKVARGEVDMAIHQMTEILPVAGVAIVGVLPPSLQKNTVYSGAVMKSATSAGEAAALLEFLVAAEGRKLFVSKGFAAP